MMKKLICSAVIFATFALAAPLVFAQENKKPIFLNRAQQPRHDKCKNRVFAYLDNVPYALSRLRTMEYTKPDGTRVTNKDKEHPYNNCDINDIGPVTGFVTGYMKSGLSLMVEKIPEGKTFDTTYSIRKAAVQENMTKKDFEFLGDGTILTKFKTSHIYMIPKEISKTGNEERIAIYCKIPAGIDVATATAQQRREKICSTRYVHTNGYGFGYDYTEGKPYMPARLDITARKILANLIGKEKTGPNIPTNAAAKPADSAKPAGKSVAPPSETNPDATPPASTAPVPAKPAE